jgi:hypothetical protein
MASLFKDGILLDPNTTTTNCYAAFRANTVNALTTTIVLGNVFFENYYVVFDSTP